MKTHLRRIQMFYIMLVFALVIMAGAKLAPPGKFHTDYLSKDSTTAINGIFVFLVFLCHSVGYIKINPDIDVQWTTMHSYMGQLVVVPFLFFSGYGIMCSIKSKGTSYVKGIFKKRFLPLLLHFDIAVFLFFLVNLIFIKKDYSLKDTLLAFLTWTSIGNSNWYIGATLLLYIALILSFLVFRKYKLPALIMMTVLTVILIFSIKKTGKSSSWYNTMIVFTFGMWYGYLKEKIDAIVMKNHFTYLLFLLPAVGVFVFLFERRFRHVIFHSVWAMAFAAVIVLVMMKVKIGNPIISALGKHVFSIYILQRIPMLLIQHFGITDISFNFVLLSFVSTLFIALIFDKVIAVIDKKLFFRKASEKAKQ